jgi:flagellar motor switch protein FliN/FliY
VVRLDQPLGEPVDILVNGERVGRGEIVVVGDQFGVRVSELLDPAARKKA